MRDLDLPRGDERELVIDRDRVYDGDGTTVQLPGAGTSADEKMEPEVQLRATVDILRAACHPTLTQKPCQPKLVELVAAHIRAKRYGRQPSRGSRARW